MVRSYPRNNFLDILRDPLTVTLMASIALHAAVGAYLLPILTKAQPEGIKADPGTVKVVELTPNELQRIPQAPEPIPTPTPAQPVLPPVYKPSTPVAPTAPKYSTTIPASPIRTPPKKTATNTPKGSKNQPTKAPASGGIFDPEIFNTPSPKPSKPPTKKGETSKASPKPIVTPSIKPTTSPKPATKAPTPTKPQATADPNTDDDGGGQTSSNTPPTTPPKTSQQPVTTPTTKPAGSATTQLPSNQQNNGSPSGGGTKPFGAYDQAATARLRDYYTKYPDLKAYPTKRILQQYPAGIPCSKVKQPPFIVLMVALDKIVPGQDADILGNDTSNLPENEKPYVDGDPTILKNTKLLEVATTAGFSDATTSDRNRPDADKNRHVLYSYRVEFDPATCKN